VISVRPKFGFGIGFGAEIFLTETDVMNQNIE